MNFLRYLLPATLSLLIATNVGSQDLNSKGLKVKAKNKISAFKDGKINTLSNEISKNISSFAKEHLKNMKHLDFNINAQEYLKAKKQ